MERKFPNAERLEQVTSTTFEIKTHRNGLEVLKEFLHDNYRH
jgi:hypothetical protein